MVDVLIVYDSKSGHTEKAAKKISEGVKESGATVSLKPVQDATLEDIKDARGLILGSLCVDDNYSGELREFINDKLKVSRPGDKIGAAFGTYKMDGGNLKKLEDDLHWLGMPLVAEGVNIHHNADDAAYKKLEELGKKVGAEALKHK
jgi:flavorubredoxin